MPKIFVTKEMVQTLEVELTDDEIEKLRDGDNEMISSISERFNGPDVSVDRCDLTAFRDGDEGELIAEW